MVRQGRCRLHARRRALGVREVKRSRSALPGPLFFFLVSTCGCIQPFGPEVHSGQRLSCLPQYSNSSALP